ncbi:MAG: cytochrome c3 family protein [bacterium]
MKKRSQMAAAVMCALALRAGAQTETSCRPCHTADRPTRDHADLSPCTRVEPRGTHTAAEGPEWITMSEGTGHYGRVEFSHKVHAQMAEMGRGCSECHHEATEGRPMRRCDECHSTSRMRADLETPDLRGAIHRQCMNCHALWDPDPPCASCHVDGPATPAARATPAAGNERSLVLYRFHRDVACEKCHKDKRASGKLEAACATCHDDWPASFDHRTTGLALDAEHVEASCEDCHEDATFAAPPSCSDCHEDKSYPADLPGKRIDVPPGVEGASS